MALLRMIAGLLCIMMLMVGSNLYAIDSASFRILLPMSIILGTVLWALIAGGELQSLAIKRELADTKTKLAAVQEALTKWKAFEAEFLNENFVSDQVFSAPARAKNKDVIVAKEMHITARMTAASSKAAEAAKPEGRRSELSGYVQRGHASFARKKAAAGDVGIETRAKIEDYVKM